MTTHYSERKVYTSSYFVQIGGSRSKSIDGESVEFVVDPVSSKLVRDKIGSIDEKAPEFVTKPKRQFVNEGETAKFKASFEGSPSTELTWSVNGKDITKDDRHKLYIDNDYHILEVQKVVAKDQGAYTCTIKNSAGSAEATAELEIFVRPKPHTDKSVFLPPTVDVPLEDTEFADKEKDATLICKFHNGFDATAKWYKDGREVGTWQAKQTFDGRTAKLVFREAAKRITGVYECIVKNTGGEAKTRALVSLLDPKIKPEAPKFKLSLADQNVESGEKLVLETEVTGLPRPSLKWYKDNTELGSSQDIRMEYKNGKGRLIMDKLSADDASKFTCVAQNVAGEAQTSAAVTVSGSEDLREPPIFTKELHDMEVDDGDRVEMSVEVKGTPPFDIVWVHNNREIPHTDPICRMISSGHTHTLIIPEVFPEDEGEYVCEAYNDFGDTDTFCRLTVKEHKDSQENCDKLGEDNKLPDACESTDNAPPSSDFVYHPPPVTAIKGDNNVLTCQVARQPLPGNLGGENSQNITNISECELFNTGDSQTFKLPRDKAAGETHSVKGQVIAAADKVYDTVTENSSNSSNANYSHRSAVFIPIDNPDKTDGGEHSRDSRLDHNQNLKHLKSSSISPKPDPAPFVTRKGGVEQVDFRSVLKNTSQAGKTHGKVDQIKQKTPSNTHVKSGTDFRTVLKHNVHTKVKDVSIHGEKDKPLIDGSNTSKFRVPTEKETKTDFRKVLKHNDHAVKSDFTRQKNKKSELDLITNKRLETRKPPSLCLNTDSAIDFAKRRQTYNTGYKTSSLKHPIPERDSKNVQNVNSAVKGKAEFQRVELRKTRNVDSHDKLEKKDITLKINPNPVSKILQKFESNQNTSSAKVDLKGGKNYQKEDSSLVKNNSKEKTMEPKSKDFPLENHIGLNPKPVSAKHSEELLEDAELTITDKTIIAKIEEELKNPPALTEEPEVTSEVVKPEFMYPMEDRLVPYGSEVVLECQVTGKPDPDIAWAVNNTEIKKSKYFQMSYQDTIARLVIAETFSEDEGEYTCIATNTQGSATCTCDIRVDKLTSVERESEESSEISEDEIFSPTVSPPKIYDISPERFCIVRGCPIEFRASFSAVPQGTVKWLLNKEEIVSDGRINIKCSEHFSVMSISKIEPRDSGRISFVVENDIGFDTAYASLTVQDVPDPPVGSPSVSDVTLTSLTLSWYGPAYDGGCPITNYRVEMCDAEDQHWIIVKPSCKNTTCFIDGLTPHTPYFFRVFAENKVGLSQPCQTSDVTVTTERKPSGLMRTLSFDSDDVFAPDEVFTPVCEYGTVSPLSPDEIPFEHREVKSTAHRKFEDLYECQQEVGKGKFGNVYKCVEKATGKHWAAKILKCREADKSKVRLEIEVMNQLQHPKILMLWDAFEAPRKMILVMEYVGGGELFERVLDDDFDLTERDCIQFMRQICDAVNYMHSRNILHLDLKPENVLCVKNESNKIKIIDFGLARFYKPGESTRVLFGTPEFIAPEVVNYEEIGFKTDMWSIGVICYVLLTGLSPFMGDSDAETLSNVTVGDFDYEDDSFDGISEDAKDFIDHLLLKDKRKRLSAQQSLEHPWLASDSARLKTRRINTSNLKRFMARRKWQKTGTAIRALGRMTSLQRLFKKDMPAAPVYDSGNGSVSSTSSLSSVDSQSTLSSTSNNSTMIDNNRETSTNRNDKNGPALSSLNTEERIPEIDTNRLQDYDKQLTNPGNTDRNETVTNAQESRNSALNVNSEQDKTDIQQSWRTNLKPANTSEKHQSTIGDAKPLNKLIGKFEATNNNDTCGNDNKSMVKMELSNRTPSKCESTNQIKVKLKSSNETQTHSVKNIEPASSSENHTRNELHQKGHNDIQDPEPPHFVKEMIDSKAFPGDSVRFDVECAGEPRPEVLWFFEEDIISESPRHIIQSTDSGTHSLIIKDVNEDDDGEYFCKIVNTSDDLMCSAELIVYGAI